MKDEIQEFFGVGDLKNISGLIDALTVSLGERFYAKQLHEIELTNARDAILKVFKQTDKPISKDELIRQVKLSNEDLSDQSILEIIR